MERRTYSKLSSELIQLDTEMGFLSCSVRVSTTFDVEDYKTYDWGTGENVTSEGNWKIGFDE